MDAETTYSGVYVFGNITRANSFRESLATKLPRANLVILGNVKDALYYILERDENTDFVVTEKMLPWGGGMDIPKEYKSKEGIFLAKALIESDEPVAASTYLHAAGGVFGLTEDDKHSFGALLLDLNIHNNVDKLIEFVTMKVDSRE